MAIVYDKLMALKIPDSEQAYTAGDPIFYALSLGLGQDPMNEDELRFVYEKDLKVLPTFTCVVAHPGFWARDLDTGIDWVKGVHGEHQVVLHKPLAPKGSLIGRTRVESLGGRFPLFGVQYDGLWFDVGQKRDYITVNERLLAGELDVPLPYERSPWGYTGANVEKDLDRKSTRLNSSHRSLSRMPSSA